jgi:hypothetical protein
MRPELYVAWDSMKQRCLNPKNAAYKNYGARGITVCERWRGSFELFLADMGARPSPQHTIERLNNDRGYEPGNCCWATRSEQNRNQRKRERPRKSYIFARDPERARAARRMQVELMTPAARRRAARHAARVRWG